MAANPNCCSLVLSPFARWCQTFFVDYVFFLCFPLAPYTAKVLLNIYKTVFQDGYNLLSKCGELCFSEVLSFKMFILLFLLNSFVCFVLDYCSLLPTNH